MSQNPYGPVNQDLGALLSEVSVGPGTYLSKDTVNIFGTGGIFGVQIGTLTGTLTIYIDGKDLASGSYYNILTGAGQNAAGFIQMTIFPGGLTSSNVATPQPLPRTFRVRAVLTGTSASFTVGCSLIN
jgi:hypothetical protein